MAANNLCSVTLTIRRLFVMIVLTDRVSCHHLHFLLCLLRFSAPGRRGGFGARPTFWIVGRKCNAGQNKLRSELLAGGGKLCTHNLLMVCKLRAEFAPSSILHLSLPFFSLHTPVPL